MTAKSPSSGRSRLKSRQGTRDWFSREKLPQSRGARIIIGVLLVLGGLLGFLPILGFWMIPVGLTILAIDIPAVRRFTRRTSVAAKRMWNKIRS
jgi:hypothetical protein